MCQINLIEMCRNTGIIAKFVNVKLNVIIISRTICYLHGLKTRIHQHSGVFSKWHHAHDGNSSVKDSIPTGCVPPACRPYLMVSQVLVRGRLLTTPLPPPEFTCLRDGYQTPHPRTYPPLGIPTPHWKGPGTRDTPQKDMGPEVPTPPPCGQTDTCENITFR